MPAVEEPAGVIDVHDPLAGMHATVHLALPGQKVEHLPQPVPGTMCGAVLGPLVGLGPLDEIKMACVVDRPDWVLCPRCFPRG